MSRQIHWLGLFVALVFIVPATAASKKTDKPPTKEKIVAAGEITGKIISLEPSQKTFTVQVTQKIPVVNQDQANALRSWQVEQLKAQSIANINDRLNRLRECNDHIAYHTQRLYTTQDNILKFDLIAADEIKVRVATPPVEFDDRGKPKKYTSKELKALKGPGNLWGYPAEFEGLRTEQTVKVFIAKAKGKPSTKEKEGDAGDRLSVVMVHILQEPKK